MKHNGREDEGAAHVSRRKFMAQAATAGGAGLAAAHALAAQENSNKAQPATPAKPAVAPLGTMIEYKSGDVTLPAYLARPPKKKQASVVAAKGK